MDWDHELDDLLVRAKQNDQDAIQALLSTHRGRLQRLVTVRMHERLKKRVDPSDVIQDAMLEASQKLPEYLELRPMPFYLWLRRLVWQKLAHLHRHHFDAQRRSISRESQPDLPLSEASSIQLVNQLAADGTSPSNGAVRKELYNHVRNALEQLANHDREILVMLYLEQLSMYEVSQELGISQRAANMRHLRALKRVRSVFTEEGRI